MHRLLERAAARAAAAKAERGGARLGPAAAANPTPTPASLAPEPAPPPRSWRERVDLAGYGRLAARAPDPIQNHAHAADTPLQRPFVNAAPAGAVRAAAAPAALGPQAAQAPSMLPPLALRGVRGDPPAPAAGAIAALAAAAEAEAARPRQPATPPVGKPATATTPGKAGAEPDFLSMVRPFPVAFLRSRCPAGKASPQGKHRGMLCCGGCSAAY